MVGRYHRTGTPPLPPFCKILRKRLARVSRKILKTLPPKAKNPQTKQLDYQPVCRFGTAAAHSMSREQVHLPILIVIKWSINQVFYQSNLQSALLVLPVGCHSGRRIRSEISLRQHRGSEPCHHASALGASHREAWGLRNRAVNVWRSYVQNAYCFHDPNIGAYRVELGRGWCLRYRRWDCQCKGIQPGVHKCPKNCRRKRDSESLGPGRHHDAGGRAGRRRLETDPCLADQEPARRECRDQQRCFQLEGHHRDRRLCLPVGADLRQYSVQDRRRWSSHVWNRAAGAQETTGWLVETVPLILELRTKEER